MRVGEDSNDLGNKGRLLKKKAREQGNTTRVINEGDWVVDEWETVDVSTHRKDGACTEDKFKLGHSD